MVNIKYHNGNYRFGPDFRALFDVPPSVNNKHEVREGRIVNTTLYENWMIANERKMSKHFNGYKIPDEVPAYLKIRAHLERKRDLDNIIKPIQDCLELAGAIEDDCWFDSLDVDKDKNLPLRRFRVEFGEITPGKKAGPANDPFEYNGITKPGIYHARILDSTTMPYSTQTNRYMVFTYEVIDAASERSKFIGYRFADDFRIDDSNEFRKKAACLKLSQLISSVGKKPENIEKTDKLNGLETVVKLRIAHDENKKPKVIVTKYSSA